MTRRSFFAALASLAAAPLLGAFNRRDLVGKGYTIVTGTIPDPQMVYFSRVGDDPLDWDMGEFRLVGGWNGHVVNLPFGWPPPSSRWGRVIHE